MNESIKEDLTLWNRKLARERTDMQVQFAELKHSVQEAQASIDHHVSEIRYLKKWSYKLNEVMHLQSLAEVQEEMDKHTISLIGYKESVTTDSGNSNLPLK